jgi:hypothetical protein
MRTHDIEEVNGVVITQVGLELRRDIDFDPATAQSIRGHVGLHDIAARRRRYTTRRSCLKEHLHIGKLEARSELRSM